MKKLISILLCAAMLLAFVACKKEPPIEANNSPAPTEAVTENPTEVPTEAQTPEPTSLVTSAPEQPEEAVLTEVLRCGIGNGDDQLGIDMTVEGNVPEAFSIFDDSIAVLDSVKQRVCIYENGALARTIDLTQAHGMIYGYSMARTDSSLFVYDVYSDMIFDFDYFSGKIKGSYSIPEELWENGSCDLFEIEGGIFIGAIRTEHGRLNNILFSVLDPEAPKLCLCSTDADLEKYVWSTPFTSDENCLERNENRFYYFINNDSIGNSYFVVVDLIPDMEDYICGDLYLIRCTPDGEITGYAGFQNELEIKIPHRHALVLEDGRVFEMMVTETEVVIYEVTFGKTYNSRLDELKEYYKNKFGLDVS